MNKLNSFKAKTRALAGYFYGLSPLEFELSFEEGFKETRKWLDQHSTREGGFAVPNPLSGFAGA